MKKVLTIFFFLILQSVNAIEVNKEINRINEADTLNYMRDFLKVSRPSRFPGTPGSLAAKKYLQDFLKNQSGQGIEYFEEIFAPDIASAILMYESDLESFKKTSTNADDFKKWTKFTDHIKSVLKSMHSVQGSNFIWKKKGESDDFIVLAVNYDSITQDKVSFFIDRDARSPGADNNATGVVLAMRLIELLRHQKTKKTIWVVFLDMEQIGFLGSRAFYQAHQSQLHNKNFHGIVGASMLGNDTVEKDKEKKFGNFKVYTKEKNKRGFENDLFLAETLVELGRKAKTKIEFSIVNNGFNSFSHAYYWEKNLAGICFSQDWENDLNFNRFNTANDFAETLNFKTFNESIRFISAAILAWLTN